MKYEFSAELWLYEGKGGWHFLTLPKDISAEIKKYFGQGRPGWGAIKVTAKIGDAGWKTSIFPDKKRDAYLLPVKADVRQEVGIASGNIVKTRIELHP